MNTIISKDIREKVQDTIRAIDPEAYIDLEGWDIQDEGTCYTRTVEDELFTIDGGDGTEIEIAVTITVHADLHADDYGVDGSPSWIEYDNAACEAEVTGIEVYGGEIPQDIADSIVGMAA